MRIALLAVLCLAPALAGLAAVPSADAHICIEGTRYPGACSSCPNLGLVHYHTDRVGPLQFHQGYCILA